MELVGWFCICCGALALYLAVVHWDSPELDN